MDKINIQEDVSFAKSRIYIYIKELKQLLQKIFCIIWGQLASYGSRIGEVPNLFSHFCLDDFVDACN
jgi:hypothetical protein